MNILIYSNITNPSCKEHIKILFDLLVKKNASIFVFAPFFEFWKKHIEFSSKNISLYNTYEELKDNFNYMLSLGGDGTFLESVKYVRKSNTPIVGINMGRLGFLSTISQEEIPQSIENIYNNKYYLEERNLIRFSCKSSLFNDFPFALNDVTVQKRDSSMLTIHTFVNNDLLNSYWADGLIISTATGSTAYSLSVGGPIVDPSSGNLVISPIAPHNLSIRPVILQENVKIRLKAESRNNSFLVTIDSRTEVCSTECDIEIASAGFKVKLLHFENYNFYNTIRNKLNWGIDKRN